MIVTNLGALLDKYGDKLKQVQAALNELITADRARGLTTRLVALDSATEMAAVHGRRRSAGMPAAPRRR